MGGVAILSYRHEGNRKELSDVLWDLIEKNSAPWAKHLKKMHEQALKEKAMERASDFVAKLKLKVQTSNTETRKLVEELRDPQLREDVLMGLGVKDLQDVAREMLSRMDSVVQDVE